MAQLSISDAARVAGVSRVTLHRYIKAGKLSRTPEGLIDTAELLRLGMVLHPDTVYQPVTVQQEVTPPATPLYHPLIQPPCNSSLACYSANSTRPMPGSRPHRSVKPSCYRCCNRCNSRASACLRLGHRRPCPTIPYPWQVPTITAGTCASAFSRSCVSTLMACPRRRPGNGLAPRKT